MKSLKKIDKLFNVAFIIMHLIALWALLATMDDHNRVLVSIVSFLVVDNMFRYFHQIP